MSDGPQGSGWWQASDGRWYPPELLPGTRPEPTGGTGPAPEAATFVYGAPPGSSFAAAPTIDGWTPVPPPRFTEPVAPPAPGTAAAVPPPPGFAEVSASAPPVAVSPTYGAWRSLAVQADWAPPPPSFTEPVERPWPSSGPVPPPNGFFEVGPALAPAPAFDGIRTDTVDAVRAHWSSSARRLGAVMGLAAVGFGAIVWVAVTVYPQGHATDGGHTSHYPPGALSFGALALLAVAIVTGLFLRYRVRGLALLRSTGRPMVMSCYPWTNRLGVLAGSRNTRWFTSSNVNRVADLFELEGGTWRPVVQLKSVVDAHSKDPPRTGVPVLLFGDPSRQGLLAVVDLTRPDGFCGVRSWRAGG